MHESYLKYTENNDWALPQNPSCNDLYSTWCTASNCIHRERKAALGFMMLRKWKGQTRLSAHFTNQWSQTAVSLEEAKMTHGIQCPRFLAAFTLTENVLSRYLHSFHVCVSCSQWKQYCSTCDEIKWNKIERIQQKQQLPLQTGFLTNVLHSFFLHLLHFKTQKQLRNFSSLFASIFWPLCVAVLLMSLEKLCTCKKEFWISEHWTHAFLKPLSSSPPLFCEDEMLV